ncbi:unnamed protein product [Dicrocoelium dendriticum]|nr:unnamed protein product [Dicrocoelium dendriticum]
MQENRIGWKVILREKLGSMSIPFLITSIIRSLLGKMDELTSTINSREYSQLCIILLQETWLHGQVDDAFVSRRRVQCHRDDRPCNPRHRGSLLTISTNIS